MRRLTVPDNILEHNKTRGELLASIASIHAGIAHLAGDTPDASVIIPAYNEEDSILKTLSSLSKSSSALKIEIIVVNNNSSDTTADLAFAAGAICLNETVQGITAARNCGLRHARGRYILNADADTIYPPAWVDLMVFPLNDVKTAMVYGDHYFLPGVNALRVFYLAYEYAADLVKWANRFYREEAVNVYGFNSAFRREDGLEVDGFNHPPGTNEDGWLAVKLRARFKRKLYRQSDSRAIVWTSDRRLAADGGWWRAAVKRMKKFI